MSGKGRFLTSLKGWEEKYEVSNNLNEESCSFGVFCGLKVPLGLHVTSDSTADIDLVSAGECGVLSYYDSDDAFTKVCGLPQCSVVLRDIYVKKDNNVILEDGRRSNNAFKLFMVFNVWNEFECVRENLTWSDVVSKFGSGCLFYLNRNLKLRSFEKVFEVSGSRWLDKFCSLGGGFVRCFCGSPYRDEDLYDDRASRCSNCLNWFHVGCMEKNGLSVSEEGVCLGCSCVEDSTLNCVCGNLVQYNGSFCRGNESVMWGCDFCPRRVHESCLTGSSEEKKRKLSFILDCEKRQKICFEEGCVLEEGCKVSCSYMIDQECIKVS